jgi:hypothetical protein
MPTMRNEAHITSAQNGHCLSVDCWCEPRSIFWVINAHNVPVLVVEHNDDTLEHRLVVTARRERDLSEPYSNNPSNAWITRVLADVRPQPEGSS